MVKGTPCKSKIVSTQDKIVDNRYSQHESLDLREVLELHHTMADDNKITMAST